MADFGIGRTGGSLRDALNQAYPMTGLGEYNTAYPPMMFPPASGADQPSAAVPLPRPRPPQAPGVLPPGMMAPGGVPPGIGQAPGLQTAPGLAGSIPPGGQYGGPQSYAARLGLGGPY